MAPRARATSSRAEAGGSADAAPAGDEDLEFPDGDGTAAGLGSSPLQAAAASDDEVTTSDGISDDELESDIDEDEDAMTDDDDEEEEEGEEDGDDDDEVQPVLMSLLGMAGPPRQGSLASTCRKLPVTLPPVQGEVSYEVNLLTRGSNVRHTVGAARLQQGTDISHMASLPKHSDSQPRSSSSAAGRRDSARLAASRTSPPTSDAPGTSTSASASTAAAASASGHVMHNKANLLLVREMGLGDVPRFSAAQRRHLSCHSSALPSRPLRQVDRLRNRAYIGQYSQDGQYFVAAFQDKRVRLYDVDNGWQLRKDVQARMARWTVTDAAISHDQRFLLYSSIVPVVHVVQIGSAFDIVDSIANVTEVHDMLDFSGQREEEEGQGGGGRAPRYRDFGIWSVAWSPDSTQVLAGTNENSALVYDLATAKVATRIVGHSDDVNAVTYLGDSPDIWATGSDDSMIKVWDRRQPSGVRRPAGVLVGHTEGVTHLCSKGDGRYLLSNCKDQTAKLWDVRAMVSAQQAAASQRRADVPRFNWDYRWMGFPGDGYEVKHPADVSVMTYRGHQVLQTLIRAYFSPADSTGQRFVYSGSYDGSVFVYDLVTGQLVKRLQYHSNLVRDCSWHPNRPELTTVSWDGSVVTWGVDEGQRGGVASAPGDDAFDGYN